MRKLCSAYGCEDLAVPGRARCGVHDEEAERALASRRAAAQTSVEAQAGRKLYRSQAWRRAARAFLRANPVCVDCGDLGVVEAAGDVDHVVPHRGDRALFWDRSNWQALCKRCHSRKTAGEVWHRR